MDVQDYLKEQEKQLATANVDQITPTPPLFGQGTIICTDSRLVFDTAQSVTDIRLESISEVDYSPPSYLNLSTILGVVAIFISIPLWFAIVVIPPIPSIVQIVSMVVFLVGVLLVIIGIIRAKATLVIKTGQSKYRFRGNQTDVSELPHAIRGAEIR
ncbi:hypothetical protein GOC74_02510 [Halomicrobium mukohataei]|uniref:Uncharacterized protein n=1 Tax=Halomicrobium mukohataei TaxID=57705 RepID=A0A847U975_9EURY|nr:hypothetical protein [Halomicrobium mukohataei]NLV08807.1 hypothetical protein [Halomicrobium mukohataei]